MWKKAYELERQYISEYNSTDPANGYNISTGGKGTCGVPLGEEQKAKLIEAISGKIIIYTENIYQKRHDKNSVKHIKANEIQITVNRDRKKLVEKYQKVIRKR